MKVVIRLAELQANKACKAYLLSPEWDEKEQALVYPDWDATVARHLAMGPEGVVRLAWLIAHKLVPMTAAQLSEARALDQATPTEKPVPRTEPRPQRFRGFNG